MLTHKQLTDFADLAIKVGVNLQKDQRLVVNCPIECADFARIISLQAFKAGAKDVSVLWNDEKLSRIRMENADIAALEDIPSWLVCQKKEIIEKNIAIISIVSSDPAIYEGIDIVKIKRYSKAHSIALKDYRNATMNNEVRWCVVSVPSAAWALKVFPNLSQKEAIDKLWEAIAVAMRLNEADPVKAWKEHVEKLTARAQFLNESNFDSIHLKNNKGTDLTVGLPAGHIWTAAGEVAKDGVMFTANMPTEEIFTVPHRNRVNGKVVNALPLSYNGVIIDGFFVEFNEGRAVNFGAKIGEPALKELINTDEGSHYLGEIALIGKYSPISNLKTMFYNTLFDENASCHLAFGKGYPSTIKGGESMTVEQLLQKGINDSVEHCDFMIGTPDLNVTGIRQDGSKVNLFVDGEWVI